MTVAAPTTPAGSLRAALFGKPDGTLVRLRCRILGHAWEGCYDECCKGLLCWCRRCLANDAHLRDREPCEHDWRYDAEESAGPWTGYIERCWKCEALQQVPQ